jgi:hypothetical protein
MFQLRSFVIIVHVHTDTTPFTVTKARGEGSSTDVLCMGSMHTYIRYTNVNRSEHYIFAASHQAWRSPSNASGYVEDACMQEQRVTNFEADVGPIVVGEWSLATDNCGTLQIQTFIALHRRPRINALHTQGFSLTQHAMRAALWLNGFNDQIPGFPYVECSFVRCPEPYMGREQPGAPPDPTMGPQDPFGTGGPHVRCVHEASFAWVMGSNTQLQVRKLSSRSALDRRRCIHGSGICTRTHTLRIHLRASAHLRPKKYASVCLHC